MYRVTCNGKNLNYGKDGQRIIISNNNYKAWTRPNKKNKDEIPFYKNTAKYEGSGNLQIKIIN